MWLKVGKQGKVQLTRDVIEFNFIKVVGREMKQVPYTIVILEK